MPNKITYYAIVGGSNRIGNPRGLVFRDALVGHLGVTLGGHDG